MPQTRTEKGGVYAEVASTLPVEKTFHYAIPSQFQSLCEVGKRVLVPLGKRTITGYILEFPSQRPPNITDKDIKEISDVLDETPLFGKGMLRFFRWVSDYYLAPLGQVIKTALPPGINWESYYHCSLTQEGKEAATEGSPQRTPALKVLQAIDPRHGTPLKQLLKTYPNRSLYFSLQKKGLITLEAKMKPGRTKAKKITVVEAVYPPVSPEPLTPREGKIYVFLTEHKKVPLGDLRKQFRQASAVLKKLIKKGMVKSTEEEVYREPMLETVTREEAPFSLNPEQQAALEQIHKALKKHSFSPFLLYGVTGSGKTEVYLRAIQEAISLDKQVLILVPEISLTPQLVGRFQRKLGAEMALLHSGLSPGERYDQWRKVYKGLATVAIGARSAVFAPCKDLGLIIVDEEHETSYKQEDGVRYNARDLALVRAQREKAVVILGSATPSLESFYNAQQGKYHLLHLAQRVGGGVLPNVDIVDLKREKHTLFSPPLQEAVAKNLHDGGQSLLFLNRRGFSRTALCTECGRAFTCRHCSVTLTFHAQQKTLLCHYCGYQVPAFPVCPHCGGGTIQLHGLGTEKVEEEVRHLFPRARVARMDSDVMTHRGAHAKLLQALEKREIDILVGTQMIVKGHDFPWITLVGIITADVALNLPELRSSERCFQLISQAAGRAGRGTHPARVIIQTFVPEHYAIQRAKEHDFVGFYQQEMAVREALRYPPVTRMVNIRVSSRSPRDAEGAVQRLAQKGEEVLKRLRDEVEILGPSPAPLYQIKGSYRWHLLLKGETVASLQHLSRTLIHEGKSLKGVRVEVDVDPLSML
jgi:primosomal protein N' (replication factor Y)